MKLLSVSMIVFLASHAVARPCKVQACKPDGTKCETLVIKHSGKVKTPKGKFISTSCVDVK